MVERGLEGVFKSVRFFWFDCFFFLDIIEDEVIDDYLNVEYF